MFYENSNLRFGYYHYLPKVKLIENLGSDISMYYLPNVIMISILGLDIIIIF